MIVGRRRQNFDPVGEGVGVFEDWTEVETVFAEVLPINALTFYTTGGAEQIDTPVTHRITTRWLGYLDNTYKIIRNTKLPDQMIRGELFRIRRVKELNGRKRFTSLDCELEKVSLTKMTAQNS